MFITRSNQSYEIWHNTPADDFLRFLPEKLSVAKEELETWFVPPQHRAALIDKIKQGGCVISINQQNDLILTKLVGENLLTELAVGVSKITEWPYNEAGKFVGFQGI